MPFDDLTTSAYHFLRTRFALRFASRKALLDWQAKKIERFVRVVLPGSPFYAEYAGCPLSAVPVITKADLLRNFDEMNTVGVGLEEASRVAEAAEQSRDFTPRIGNHTVGFSSGTQGPRGVFLVSDRERAMWAGVMLARTLSRAQVKSLLWPTSPPIRIALFLRANSNLYRSLNSSRVKLLFLDLFADLSSHLQSLERYNPDVIVAPARVLRWVADQVAEGSLRVTPKSIFSVAEVLEPFDARRIEHVFGQRAHQLYQATEGFLGYTCEEGVIHLNEEFVHVEPEWIDKNHTRFVPIVTDFTRTSQLIVRYRLDDVLRVRDHPCECGRVSLALDGIEGRADDVLWFRSTTGGMLLPIFPDMVRHALLLAACPGDYRIVQRAETLDISISDASDEAFAAVTRSLGDLAIRQGTELPSICRASYTDLEWDKKCRRIVCALRP
jgi:putative adenylate-forming enzyme